MNNQGVTELDRLRQELADIRGKRDYWAKLAATLYMERNQLQQKLREADLENLQLASALSRMENQQYYL